MRKRSLIHGMGLFITVVLSGLCLIPNAAFGHRVTIFAWVEGDAVHTESKFSGGKRVNEGTVNVYDTAGTLLITGKTDENGAFTFVPKEKIDLHIVLEAGMGHRGEWQLKKDDFSPAFTNTAKAEPSPNSTRQDTAALLPVAMDAEALSALVEKAVEKKIAPIMAALAEAQNPEPSMRDVIGGVGYIFGLMGLSAWVYYRRKSK